MCVFFTRIFNILLPVFVFGVSNLETVNSVVLNTYFTMEERTWRHSCTVCSLVLSWLFATSSFICRVKQSFTIIFKIIFAIYLRRKITHP